MNESRDHHTKWRRSHRGRDVLPEITYMWTLKIEYQFAKNFTNMYIRSTLTKKPNVFTMEKMKGGGMS